MVDTDPMKHLAVISCLLLAGCADKGGLRVQPIVHPVPRNHVAPAVDAVSAPVEAVDASNRALESKVASLRREAATARTEASRATAEAGRLAAIGTATKAELDGLWKSLQAVEARNLFLEAEEDQLARNVEAQRTVIADLRVKVTEAQRVAAMKDAEVAELRNVMDEANVRLLQADVALTQATKRYVHAEQEAANAKVYKRWCIVGAISFAGIWLLREIIPRLLKP